MTMTLHELNGHLDMVTQLNDARETLQNMQSRILGASQYDGMPHAHNASRKVENFSILLDTLTAEVQRLEKIVSCSEKSGIRAWIEAIPDSRTMAVFNLRFLCGCSWGEVAALVGGRNTEEAVKAVCYRYLQVDDEA